MFFKRKISTTEFIDHVRDSSEREMSILKDELDRCNNFKLNPKFERMESINFNTQGSLVYLNNKKECNRLLDSCMNQLELLKHYEDLSYPYNFISSNMVEVILKRYYVSFINTDVFLGNINEYTLDRVENFYITNILDDDISYIKEDSQHLSETKYITKVDYEDAYESSMYMFWGVYKGSTYYPREKEKWVADIPESFTYLQYRYSKQNKFKLLTQPNNVLLGFNSKKDLGNIKIKDNFYIVLYPVRGGYLFVCSYSSFNV